MSQQTVLLVGGTGRTGQRVLKQLLDRGVRVRAIVRSRSKIPPDSAANPNLEVVEASLLSLSDEALEDAVRGSHAVISCLGHVITLKGIFGPPRDLVTSATRRLCRAIQAVKPSAPVELVLMGSVSVNRPDHLDTRRGTLERAVLAALRGLVPPAKDNQRAADFLLHQIGENDPFIQWVVIRPDTLLAGDVTEYSMHEGLVSTLFSPGSTNMANVAHAMCELVTNPRTWAEWRGKLPVVVNSSEQAR